MSVKFKELLYERSVKGSETIKKEKDEPTASIFDFLNQIWTKQEKYPYDKKIASGWQLTMWIAQDPELIHYAHKVCKMFFHMTDEMIYRYYFHSIPKRKRWIKWTRKDDMPLKQQKKVEEIMDIHEVSKQEAMLIFKHLSNLEKLNAVQ
jgi:hypothetical protein